VQLLTYYLALPQDPDALVDGAEGEAPADPGAAGDAEPWPPAGQDGAAAPAGGW
jgi:hypothetical protein